MTRAALLPTPGDPFLLNLWLQFYKRFWVDEVDKLYVFVNSPIAPEAIEYMRELVEATPKAVFIYENHMVEHGEGLRRMIELATEDLLMFVEDDGFIYKAGRVRLCFDRIEGGEVDAVGGRRGSCSKWLYDTASEKWGIDNSGYGDTGPNFWPNFFFAKREDLLKVTNFEAKTWLEGDEVIPLGKVAPELQASDTFVDGSLQLRAMGLRFAYEPQYHLAADDLDDYHNSKNAFDPRAAWLHVGSLSSGINGMLRDPQGRSLARRHLDPPQDYPWPNAPQGDSEKMEFERRIVWFLLAYEHSDPYRIADLRAAYRQAIEQVVQRYVLSWARIEKRKNLYLRFMP